ncbi:MAG: protein kinase domain-containing protein [Candidatus Flexifilum sp.]|jgi:outer membrane protein assembly factor BamB/tRNA A-37 threonylcarbamoyl transferase component Bud32
MPETTQFTPEANSSAQDTTLRANAVLHNRYKITGVLGGGGMGTVYQARDLNFGEVTKLVAIKEMQTIANDNALRQSMLKTFRREANLLAMLSHPAIPKIFDFFDISDRAYLVMEYINGSDLELLLSKTKELPIDKLIDWAIDLCDVLDYLHSQKPDPIVFRDMKPSNVMIDNLGRVRLIDFGIAKAFISGVKNTMIGTEGYSAPEQYKGDVSPQSDIYSLGATLHQLLTRKDPRLEPPFSFHERPIPQYNPNAPEGLVQIVEKALAYNAVDRWKSCYEMKQALEELRRPTGGGSLITVVGAAGAARADAARPAVDGTDLFTSEQAGAIQPRWIFKTEDEIRGGPVTARHELALVGSYDRNLWAINLNTGEQVWKFPTKGGIAVTPAVDEGSRLVLFGSEDFTLYAVDFRNGRITWTYHTKDRIRSSVRIAHDHVFFGSDDGHVYALGLSSGRFLWAYEAGTPVRTRPFVTNDMIIFGSESGEVTAISLSGQRKWSYRTKRAIMSSPHVNMEEGICYVGSTDGYMYALDAGNGFNAWRFRTNGPIISSPFEADGMLYFASTDGNLYAVNAQNGREKWHHTFTKPIVASPIVHKGALYIGGTDDYFYCLDASSGKELWKYKTGGAITGAAWAIGDVLLFGSMDHKLYAFPIVN